MNLGMVVLRLFMGTILCCSTEEECIICYLTTQAQEDSIFFITRDAKLWRRKHKSKR